MLDYNEALKRPFTDVKKLLIGLVLSIIPIIGVTGLTEFLMAYQKGFFAIGITSSIAGILLMLNHKRKMKGGLC